MRPPISVLLGAAAGIAAAVTGALLWLAGSPPAPPAAARGALPQVPEPEWSLPEADRAMIWQAEHHGNLLGHYGLRALGDALRREDRAGLVRLLAGDFEARMCEAPRETAYEDGLLSVVRWQRSGVGDRRLDRDAFTAWLLELRGAFGPDPEARFAISSLAPIQAGILDGEWQAVCQLRVWGESAAGGPAETTVVFEMRSAAPTRARLEEPGWLSVLTVRQVTTGRADRFAFREAAADFGIDTARLHDNWSAPHVVQNTGGVFATDFNRDGIIDLLITDVRPPGVMLLKGRLDGGFDDVTRDSGLLDPSDAAALFPMDNCVFVDVDNDGWPDLIALNAGMFRNVDGQRFVPATRDSNLFSLMYGGGAPENPPLAVIPADFDRDGLVDLYVVRGGRITSRGGWIGDARCEHAGNQLLRNLGNGQFEDVTESSGTAAGGRSVFSAVWFDANNNGWPDLYVIHEFGPGTLLVNQEDGTFVERAIAPGPGDFGSMGVTVGDVDNDGHVDLYLANMYSKAGNRVMDNIPPGRYPEDVLARLRRLVDGSELYRNRGGLEFEPVGRDRQVYDVGWAWGPALADFTNDGWLDLYAPAGYVSRDRTKPDG